MAKMLYFGSHISDNIIKRDEGYIICLNVPVARTGWQTYLAKELGEEIQKQFNLADNDKVKVYRSPEEVFSKDTIHSFEGMTVTDNHPPGGQFVDAKNFKDLSCGHGQNVRRGEKIGEEQEELLADLVIQHKPLVNDVLDEKKREISCGYVYKVRPLPDGNFEQYDIRGNHFAVVQKGRAGDKVRIFDSAPAEEETQVAETVVEKLSLVKPADMKWGSFFVALGLKLFAADAKPEEIAEAQNELRMEGDMSDKTRLSEDQLRARDAELDQREKEVEKREADSKKKAADAEEAMKKAEEAKEKSATDDKHPEGCRCEDCPMGKKAKDAKAKDEKEKPNFKEIFDNMYEERSKAEAEKKKEEEDKKAKDKAKDEGMEKIDPADNPADDKARDALDPIPPVTAKEETKNPIPGADEAIATLRRIKPLVAKSGDLEAIASWNRARDAFMGPVVNDASTRGAYEALAQLTARATDSDPGNVTAEDRAKTYQANLEKANSRSQKEK